MIEQRNDFWKQNIPPTFNGREVVLVAASELNVRMLTVEPKGKSATFAFGADVWSGPQQDVEANTLQRIKSTILNEQWP